MGKRTAVGVLDKVVDLLDRLADGPAALGELAGDTGIARPTAYRLLAALQTHRLVDRDASGRYALGSRVAELAAGARTDGLLAAAPSVLATLRDETGESAQLYLREAEGRRCVAAVERATGLRDTVPVGTLLPLTAGSAAQVLLAWSAAADAGRLLGRARFDRTVLAQARRRGWAESVEEREPGVASVSAPVLGPDGTALAAVSVSGPAGRLGPAPGRRHAPAVLRAARALAAASGQQPASLTTDRPPRSARPARATPPTA